MRNQIGSSKDLYSHLETVTEHYTFMKFERVIEKTVARFSKANDNLGLINSELADIKSTMNDNLEKLYGRTKAISEMRDVASEVLNMSSTLNRRALQTKRDLMFRKYLFVGIVAALVLLVLLWKLWF